MDQNTGLKNYGPGRVMHWFGLGPGLDLDPLKVLVRSWYALVFVLTQSQVQQS